MQEFKNDPVAQENWLQHNQAIFTVAEISQQIKRSMEEQFSFIRVRGEISGLKIADSGHVYFSLKDSNAVLSAICWKGSFSRLAIKLEEGLEVICTGSITTYPGRSNYQLIVERAEIAGAGALMALLQKRKEQLTKEGLFDSARKKKLPKFPTVIGIVTSPTGAVIRDILHRFQERFPVHVLLWPVLVQGDQAAGQITAAINGFNNIGLNSEIARPDLIIVARGGGSLEDLWAFNEEIVVRAAANSSIPLISAVGHETDTTLIDYASDLRAPTPTAAAEIAVPVRSELLMQLEETARGLKQNIYNQLKHDATRLEVLTRSLPRYDSLLNNLVQRVDDLSIRIIDALPRFILTKSSILQANSARLRDPLYIVKSLSDRLNHQFYMVRQLVANITSKNHNRLLLASSALKADYIKREIDNKAKQLASLSALFASYNYKNVLARGFAIIQDEQGKIIRSTTELASQQKITIELEDGKKKIKIEQ